MQEEWHVMVKTETGVMHLQAEEPHRLPPDTQQLQESLGPAAPSRPSEAADAADLGLGATRTVREYISVV